MTCVTNIKVSHYEQITPTQLPLHISVTHPRSRDYTIRNYICWRWADWAPGLGSGTRGQCPDYNTLHNIFCCGRSNCLISGTQKH